MIALYVLSIIFIVSSYLPALQNPHWFFRIPDFIRIQTTVLQIILFVLLIIFETHFTWFSYTVLAVLLVTVTYQTAKIYPYSSWYPRKKPDAPSDGMVCILAGNVLQPNDNYEAFKDLIKKYDPDLVLTMESNKDWEHALSEIEATYPETVKVPLENLYGMHLYSKKKLYNVSVNYHIEDDVPSILFDYKLENGKTFYICCLHPAPPSPTENETSKERDAELMIVGKKIRDLEKSTVVCGDMNDVVWSRTTRLFKKMTGMIDPRIGRGFFPTYHAGHWFLRFPLDHLFHTKDLFVDKMERTSYFGSDHFAMYYEIHHKKTEKSPEKPTLNGDEKEEIEEIVERAE